MTLHSRCQSPAPSMGREPAKPIRSAIAFPAPRAEEEMSRMVEPDGIEPTTSCLQSTRSTN